MPPRQRCRTLSDRIQQPARGAIALAGVLLGLAACATPHPGNGPWAPEQEVAFAGTVASVDLAPMAYDGNALVRVSSDAHGLVTVHLPARRNLCQAEGFDLLPRLKAGDRVRVAGTAAGPADVNVCLLASHRVQLLGQ